MHVESVKFSTPYYLHYPLLPTLSLLDHVKGLIEAYKTKSNSEEDIFVSAKLLLEEINQLEDIDVQRECLCRLLKLEIEEIQNLVLEEVMPVFDFATFLYDIQHDQAQQLIDLEEIISEIIESKLKSNELNLIIPICSIYQSILEHLWLLPYFESTNHCSHLLNQNKDAILSHMERWKNSLDQLANEEKIDKSIPKNLEKAVQRIFEPLPEVVAKEIEQQKSAIHKNGEISLALLEIIADFYGNQRDFPRAIFHVEKALKIARELDDSYAIFIYLKSMGYLYVAQGKNELALPFYQKAQTISKKLKDCKSASQALVGLADAYLDIGINEDAIQCYQTALNLTEDQFTQTWICIGIGQAHANAQSYPEAKKAYLEALRFCPQNDVLLAIKIHGNLAVLFNNFGRYEKAISKSEEVLELTKHPSVQKDELDAFDSEFGVTGLLGNIYGTFRDYDREIDCQTRALKMAKKSYLFSNSLGTAYSNLGRAYCHKENYSKGIKCYNKALEITEESLAQANILLSLGNAFFNSGEFEEAIGNYKKVDKIGNQDTKKASLLGLGLCYQALENEEQAIQCIEKSICLSQETKDRRSEAIGYHNLGIVYKESNPGLAEEKYRKSIATYALLHQELKKHSQWQITFFEEQALSLLNLESLLLKQSKIEEALQVTDFRRSRALVSALTGKFKCQKNDSLSSGVTTREMQALAQNMNTCFIIYSLASESIDNITAWVIPSQGEITREELSLEILPVKIKEANRLFRTFPFIAPEDPKTAKTALPSFPEITRDEDSGKDINSTLLKSFKEHLSLWYKALIAPIESHLPKDPQQVVTIIPDGYLAQIPFATFLDKEEKYFIEKHPISIAPSIGILKLLNKIPKEFPKSSLVIGNPTTSGRRLKFAEEEAQKIVAPLLKTTPEKILLQDSATTQRVVEEMANSRWIHLACHGSAGKKLNEKIDPHSVFEGLFKLTPDESHSQGYLHAQKIAKLSLRAELVFMSACFSGRGKLHGEGSVGPVWSFLAAGALSTVATYWRLPDSGLTLQMVDTFYRHLLGIGVEKFNKAQALQKAMLVGIEKARERPDRWGAFFLSGLYE